MHLKLLPKRFEPKAHRSLDSTKLSTIQLDFFTNHPIEFQTHSKANINVSFTRILKLFLRTTRWIAQLYVTCECVTSTIRTTAIIIEFPGMDMCVCAIDVKTVLLKLEAHDRHVKSVPKVGLKYFNDPDELRCAARTCSIVVFVRLKN